MGPPKPKAAAPPLVKVFQCPGCGAGVTIHALGHSVSAACASCGTVIDVANESLAILSKAASVLKVLPVIPLGTKGKLRGQIWQCIGMMVRQDKDYPVSWREYLLFNPQQGYRWLVELDGHWNYVVRLTETPVQAYGKKVKVFGKKYRMYNDGKSEVTYVVGEFYWRVKVGETTHSVDYILPPEMLSLEESQDETVWSMAEYTEPEVIQNAFQIALPARIGVAPNQPSPAVDRSARVSSWAWSFILFLTVVQCLVIFFSDAKQVLSEEYAHSPISPKSQVTSSFTLKGMSNLEFTLAAPVANSWFEAAVDLVDEKTGDSTPFEIGVEYYTGYDSDGSWSEGSTVSKRILSAVPEGTYHLEILPSSEGSTPPPPEPQAAPSPAAVDVRRENYPGGGLKAEEPFVNGKLEGMANYYHPNGKLMASIPYKNGMKHGQFTLYREDGSKEQDLSYLNGQLNGTLRWYDTSGNLKQHEEYRNGARAPDAKSTELTYAVKVRRDVATWSNFFWAVLILSLYPLWAAWRKRSFEMARWANSDYSPYQTE